MTRPISVTALLIATLLAAAACDGGGDSDSNGGGDGDGDSDSDGDSDGDSDSDGDADACDEGEISEPCICGGAVRQSGFCCNDIWFDDHYQQVTGGCPPGDYYYVDVDDGDDGNPGTESQPWQTLPHAAAQIGAGDTLIVEDGVYDIGSGTDDRKVPVLLPGGTGTAGQPVILKARNAREVQLEFTVESSGTALGGDAKNITLGDGGSALPGGGEAKNWHVRLTGGTGAGQVRHIYEYFSGSTTARIYSEPGPSEDNDYGFGTWDTIPDSTTTYEIRKSGPTFGCIDDIEHVVWDGFYIDEATAPYRRDTGIVVIFGESNVSVGCHIINNEIDGRMSYIRDNHNGIRLEYATEVVVRNNVISGIRRHDGSHNGATVMAYGSTYVTIEHNDFTDMNSGIYVKGDYADQNNGYFTIRNNLIHDGGTKGVLWLNNGMGTPSAMYQNVVYGMTNCVSTLTSGNIPNDIDIVNNTFDDCSSGVQLRANPAFSEDLVFWNNLITNHDWAIYGAEVSSDSNTEFEHNCYHGNSSHAVVSGTTYSLSSWQSHGQDDASPSAIQADPLYVDGPARDYRLCQGNGVPAAGCTAASPALPLGVDLLDLDGDSSTSDTVPAGAYITGDEIIGPIPPFD